MAKKKTGLELLDIVLSCTRSACKAYSRAESALNGERHFQTGNNWQAKADKAEAELRELLAREVSNG